MITGYCILGCLVSVRMRCIILTFATTSNQLSHISVILLPLPTSHKLLMAYTAFFRHSIPYELFYGVHFLFFAMYALAIGEYVCWNYTLLCI